MFVVNLKTKRRPFKFKSNMDFHLIVIAFTIFNILAKLEYFFNKQISKRKHERKHVGLYLRQNLDTS